MSESRPPYGQRPSGYSNQQRTQQRTQQQERPRQQMPPNAGAGNQAPAVILPKQKLFEKFGEKFGVDQELLIETLKKTCFRGQKSDADPITNEQLVALLIVADQYGLNPFTKEIYAYPDKNGGIVPVVSVDGWIRIIQEHEQFDGMAIAVSENMLADQSERKHKHKPCWEWMEVTIFRKDRSNQIPITEYFDEVYRQSLNVKAGDGSWYEVSTPWQSHTKRMMRHKTIIQAGRVVFGFAGIYDDDEAERILAAQDDRVVQTVPPGQSRTQTAKENLRRTVDPQTAHQPKADPPPPAAERPAAQTQRPQPEQRKAPVTDANAPWDRDDDAEEGDKRPDSPAEWQELMKGQTIKDELEAIWDDVLAWFDSKNRELDIDTEAVYHLMKEKLG